MLPSRPPSANRLRRSPRPHPHLSAQSGFLAHRRDVTTAASPPNPSMRNPPGLAAMPTGTNPLKRHGTDFNRTRACQEIP